LEFDRLFKVLDDIKRKLALAVYLLNRKMIHMNMLMISGLIFLSDLISKRINIIMKACQVEKMGSIIEKGCLGRKA